MRKRNIKRSWKKQATDHQRGLYYYLHWQSVNGAKRLYGESAITVAPIFEAAGRGDKPYWGKWAEAAPTIFCGRVWQKKTERFVWRR